MSHAARTSRVRAWRVAVSVAALAATACAGGERPELMPPTTKGPPPSVATVDTSIVPSAAVVAPGDVCGVLSEALRDLLTAGEPVGTPGGEQSCAAATANGQTVSVERRDNPGGIGEAIPAYHASRRDVTLRPVGDAAPPMLWSETGGYVELAVFTDGATFIFQLPGDAKPDAALLDVVEQAVAGR